MTAPGAERSRAGPHARGRVKPHHQILVAAFAAVLALSTLGIVMSGRLGDISSASSAIVHDSAITKDLTQAEISYQSDIYEASQVLLANSAAGRSASISNLSDIARVADLAWATYKHAATGVAGERALQKTVDTADAQQIALVAPVLTGHSSSAGIAAKLAVVGATQIAAIDTLRTLYQAKQAREMTIAAAQIERTQQDLRLAVGGVLAVLVLAFIATFLAVRRRYRQFSVSEIERAVEADRNDLETRVARALEMASTEDAAYVRMARAIAETAPGRHAQVLVADSSRAHLHQALALNLPSESGGCSVGTPHDCPAITRGQTQIFSDSEALDACPYLVDRPDGPCSAACVPISAGGMGIGVVHLTATAKQVMDPELTIRLELIARKAGDRIGTLRAFNQSETEARTDQLTGLLNRRSLEDEVRQLADAGQPFTVAYGDLDHFKELNDVYGHDAGDRALRLFSRVLRDSVRPRDIPSRYGGEEFVIVLPDCSLPDATQVLERVRENLGRAQTSSLGPPFTVSFGLSDLAAGSSTDFDAMLKSADHALALAKSRGRDRVVGSTDSRPDETQLGITLLPQPPS
jgi:diguanylate cyclase (GGDEF)-like protein